jgi:hypothetical protein
MPSQDGMLIEQTFINPNTPNKNSNQIKHELNPMVNFMYFSF